MAKARGFTKVMVAAPNPATNQLLNGSGAINATRSAAAPYYAKLVAQSAGEQSYRQPTMSSRASLSRFAGTVRGGTTIMARAKGMRLSVVKRACGSKFTYK